MIEREMGYRGSKSILFLIKIVFFLAIVCLYYFDNSSLGQFSTITAAVVYGNSDLEKSNITKENKKKSGVYRWLNKINGKCYVGSSTNLSNRFYWYFNLKVMTTNEVVSQIARALLKYGYSNFQLEILEYCEPSKCTEREQYYMDLLKPEYNILKIAGSKLGIKHSKETKQKIRESLLGNKRALGGGREHQYSPIEVLDIITGLKTKYDSIFLAAQPLDSSRKAITKYLSKNSTKPFKKRYIITRIKP